MLHDLQAGVQRAILDGPESEAWRLAGQHIGEPRRLQIYRNHFRLSVVEALRKTYPVILQLVGEDFFRSLALAYIERHPPRSPCLFEYGAGFASEIRGDARCRPYPYFAEVAEFEWAINLAFHAVDADLVSPDDLLRREVPDLAKWRVALHPSVRLGNYGAPVDRIWRWHQDGCQGDLALSPTGERHFLVVWRKQEDVVYRRLSETEFQFLLSLSEEGTIADASLACGCDLDSEPMDILGFAIGAGLVSALGEPVGEGQIQSWRNRWTGTAE